MKLFKKILIGLSALGFPGVALATNTQMSGTVEAGLRVIEIPQAQQELNLTVYRGDYIVLTFSDDESRAFKVPDLGIDQILPSPKTETPYVKIKESGNFAFSLGDQEGILHVHELSATAYQELTAVEAEQLIQNIDPLIVDVRTQAEYNRGHLAGAHLFPVQMFSDNISKLEIYKNENILLYCASGNRSTVAAKMLLDAGFAKVYNMRRGVSDWQRSGFPLVK